MYVFPFSNLHNVQGGLGTDINADINASSATLSSIFSIFIIVH